MTEPFNPGAFILALVFVVIGAFGVVSSAWELREIIVPVLGLVVGFFLLALGIIGLGVESGYFPRN